MTPPAVTGARGSPTSPDPHTRPSGATRSGLPLAAPRPIPRQHEPDPLGLRRQLGWIKKDEESGAPEDVVVVEEDESGFVKLRKKNWARLMGDPPWKRDRKARGPRGPPLELEIVFSSSSSSPDDEFSTDDESSQVAPSEEEYSQARPETEDEFSQVAPGSDEEL